MENKTSVVKQKRAHSPEKVSCDVIIIYMKVLDSKSFGDPVHLRRRLINLSP